MLNRVFNKFFFLNNSTLFIMNKIDNFRKYGGPPCKYFYMQL